MSSANSDKSGATDQGWAPYSGAPLDGPRRGAASGAADSLIVLVHGYGADGNDLFSLSDVLARVFPTAAFAAPNAPSRSSLNPMGYQWFPIPWIDGSSEEEMQAGFLASATALNHFLDAELARSGVAPERLALIGFSQGTMMSLEVGPRRATQIAGIVGFSGRLAAPERIESAPHRPPVTLVHGDQDEVIPVSSLYATSDALGAAGFSVRWHVSSGVGHGIAPDGLELAAGFLMEALDAKLS
ncbi:MAG: dienelactone hydrolase family protein [Neomegalonema sp.]|nr:dienelactone hydrolase family protein [Neomegalonema sp.]